MDFEATFQPALEGGAEKTLTLQDIGQLTGAEVPDKSVSFRGVASLRHALPHHVSFFRQAKERDQLETTRAGACFVLDHHRQWVPPHTIPLITENPHRAFALLANAFSPALEVLPGRHPSAIIHPTARVPESCHLSPGVVVQAHAQLGQRCYLGPHVVVGEGVTIDDDCWIEAHVVLYHARIGRHVRIKAGSCIGQRGFGFVMEEQGCIEIPHGGLVVIKDHVEIGANCTIDRGSFQDTEIGAYSRLDNLVQVAHNVIIGERVIIVAQCGISGGCTIGDDCALGGQVGLAGHVSLAPGTQVAAKSGVMRSSRPKELLAGIPAMPAHKWRRQAVHQGFRRKEP